ncbi:MAG: UvrD-helicase domain-containing protein [Deltaproteobacteria bacterium]|jgi:superfamily I DNA/RNA helicase/mRNA-degrading endonuclease RelE of RelBE toxin-antitoxin system|nr:UvrD-helicase domain-containing protein [Deltaproteobacteria bacterium]
MDYSLAISEDFMSSFATLPPKVQSSVIEFIKKFKKNIRSQAIHLEKIQGGRDKKLFSVRINENYRGVVAKQEGTGFYLLLWVGSHDKAYQWARLRKCEVNPLTGSIQVFVAETSSQSEPLDELNSLNVSQAKPIEAAPTEAKNLKPAIAGLFASYSDQDLLALNVPLEQLESVKALADVDTFLLYQDNLPKNAADDLFWLATGTSVKDLLDIYSDSPSAPVNSGDFQAVISSPINRQSFYIVDEEKQDELRMIMAAPLEKWRVFLHPSQRKIVEKAFSGPARVLGGAGTGKTVVALHRAKFLAAGLKEGEKLLFTTFTANLAADIKENLSKICTPIELKKIEVVNIDAFVSRFLRDSGYPSTIVYGEALREIWRQAATLADQSQYDPDFLADEWAKVAVLQNAISREAYLKASRLGRGLRLDRKKRLEIWIVFSEFLNILRASNKLDINLALYECEKIAEQNLTVGDYRSAVVDEGQDLSAKAFSFIRKLTGPERANDIFIVGDARQRIYKTKVVLKQCGVDVRGRGHYLKINYRTTEEIQRRALAFLDGLTFDDLDDSLDQQSNILSLTHGEAPVIRNFDEFDQEADFIVSEINGLKSEGALLKDICLVARTKNFLALYRNKFIKAGLKVFEIAAHKVDDRSEEGVRLATMHRVKGLEFPFVFIAAANRDVIPLSSSINSLDPVSKAESLTAEKCLLYVALTRAQKKAYISSHGQPMDFSAV